MGTDCGGGLGLSVHGSFPGAVPSGCDTPGLAQAEYESLAQGGGQPVLGSFGLLLSRCLPGLHQWGQWFFGLHQVFGSRLVQLVDGGGSLPPEGPLREPCGL